MRAPAEGTCRRGNGECPGRNRPSLGFPPAPRRSPRRSCWSGRVRAGAALAGSSADNAGRCAKLLHRDFETAFPDLRFLPAGLSESDLVSPPPPVEKDSRALRPISRAMPHKAAPSRVCFFASFSISSPAAAANAWAFLESLSADAVATSAAATTSATTGFSAIRFSLLAAPPPPEDFDLPAFFSLDSFLSLDA